MFKFKTTIALGIFIVGLVAASCTHSNSRCKQDHKRVKKEGIGWKY